MAGFDLIRDAHGRAHVYNTDAEPLDHRHHQEIVERCFNQDRDLPEPRQILQYHSWSDVIPIRSYGIDTLIFVDGGITDKSLDVGMAVLVNDGGIVKHHLSCGVFYKDGGIIDAEITQRYHKAHRP